VSSAGDGVIANDSTRLVNGFFDLMVEALVRSTREPFGF
jgi:hypothetical protein